MRLPSRRLESAALLALTLACSPAVDVAPLAPPPPATAVPTTPVAAASSAPAEPAPAAAPAPTPEQLKQAEDQKKLAADYAKLEREQAAEQARITPELRERAKRLSDKSYPSFRAALAAVLPGEHRKPGNPTRDAFRHPKETLELFGLTPSQSVLEYGPGEGWYTEILAPALAKNGKLYVTSPDPNGPKELRPTLYGRTTQAFLQKLPEVYGKVEPVLIDPKAPKLPFEGKLDAVLVIRGAHGMYNNKVLTAWLAEFHRALKPNGVLGIEQHRAAPGKTADETSKSGYLAEAFVIEQVELAGFKLAAKSEINANPKDTKDHPEGVWTLPPTFRLGDKDRAKYEAIGESDRMTLKFTKLPRPVAKSKTP